MESKDPVFILLGFSRMCLMRDLRRLLNVPGTQMNQGCLPQGSGNVAPVMPGMPLFQGNFQQGPVLGGLTPQAQRMQQVLSMSQGLSSSQLLTLMQSLQEQMRTQARLNPEQFGEYVSPQEVSGSMIPGLEFSRDGAHNNLSGGFDGAPLVQI